VLFRSAGALWEAAAGVRLYETYGSPDQVNIVVPAGSYCNSALGKSAEAIRGDGLHHLRNLQVVMQSLFVAWE